MTLGPTGAAPALAALTAMGKFGQIKLATFDLSPEVLTAIAAGNMLFAIDQQQFEQGYLPIVLLKLYKSNLNTIANPILMTGPGFVTEDTALRVIDRRSLHPAQPWPQLRHVQEIGYQSRRGGPDDGRWPGAR